MNKRKKPPVTRFADGLASGKYQIVTDKKEVAELLKSQKGGKGSSSGGIDTTYTVL